MDYLNLWQALTYRNAKAKKHAVNSSIVMSCIADLDTSWGFGLIDRMLNWAGTREMYGRHPVKRYIQEAGPFCPTPTLSI